MTGLTSSPRTSRGAIVGLDPVNPLASVVAFQYNPDEMTRTLQARAAAGGSGTSEGARNEALRLTGAPIETISLTVEVDAADQLETGDPLATTYGIYPQLSCLEMLLYPKSAVVAANAALAAAGSIELISAEVWAVVIEFLLIRLPNDSRRRGVTGPSQAYTPGQANAGSSGRGSWTGGRPLTLRRR